MYHFTTSVITFHNTFLLNTHARCVLAVYLLLVSRVSSDGIATTLRAVPTGIPIPGRARFSGHIYTNFEIHSGCCVMHTVTLSRYSKRADYLHTIFQHPLQFQTLLLACVRFSHLSQFVYYSQTGDDPFLEIQ